MNYKLTKSFPLYVQQGLEYCIPASVQSIFKYHKPQFDYNYYSQMFLLQMMILFGSNHVPSFQSMVEIKAPVVTDEFNCFKLDPHNFQDWIDNIIDEINNDRPIAISTKMGENAHIRVAISIDTTAKIIELYNPGISNIVRHINSYSFIINSGFENYTYAQAEADWNLPEPCHDQLKIVPIVKIP